MRRVVMGGLVLPLTLLLGSCGGDDAPEASSSPSSSPTSSPTDEETGASPSETPSQSSGPVDTYAGFTPVAGQVIPGPAYSIATPAEWTYEPSFSEGGGVSTGDDFTSSVELDDRDATSQQSLDELVESAKQFAAFGPDGKRLDDVVLTGVTAYHYAGTDENFDNFTDEFGFQADGREVQIRVSTPQDMPQAERDEFVGSVMASLQRTAG